MNEQQREALGALAAILDHAHDRSDDHEKTLLEGAHHHVHTYILNSMPTRDGWQLVPVEPTREMMIASEGWCEYDVPDHWVNCNEVRRVYGSYRAMLAAAPTPEEL